MRWARPRASRAALVCGILFVTAGAACSNGTTSRSPDQLTGVVLQVDARSFEDVRSFELRSEGKTYRIFLDPDIEYSFPPEHLHAHLAGGDPVHVALEDRDGKLYATTLEDG